ncbi:LacI family DNA-binding transcriptional regulator [Puniceibacterium sp. IMCC21224]|uniref:LacI family DNA-binding transcriptional regulator n=1 Tax=Puniceibacterium sp. IMCC21224 TaxID=1618204 RepID=UPI00064D9D21|nr:LacI family DNA-binding transcriptional regulator [Puniceibacterium sp. IMCC21224]KMK68990.1 transcriptional regulator, LacI family [Puniceibacterium sp. IMCC21224]
MAGRPTIKDVAREAGVSATTVDRALNGRSIVREDTLRKIADAAHRIGYHGKGIFQSRLEKPLPEVRLGFILLKKTQEFYKNFEREIHHAIAERRDVRATADIRFSSSQSPQEFAELLASLGRTCDAVACTAVNDQRLNQVVQDLRDRNVIVISILNDFAQGIRHSYLGLNNMKIGRLAAWMITRTVHDPGKLAVFVGGNRWHGHDLREVGFRSLVRETGRGFTVLDTLVNLETRQVTYEATLDLLHRHPDLKGLYVAGGGMEGAIAALREVHDRPKVALVVNEVTAESRNALIDGYVVMAISTPLPELCRKLVDLMVRSTNGEEDSASGQHFLEPKIVLPELL